MLFFLLLICFFIYLISNTSVLLFAKKHFVNQATFFTFAVALGLFHSFLYGALSETGVKTRKCITLIFFPLPSAHLLLMLIITFLIIRNTIHLIQTSRLKKFELTVVF